MTALSTAPPETDHFSGITVHDGNREAVADARKWCYFYPRNRKGFLFLGPPGTGKTMLAGAMQKTCGGTWINVNQLIAGLRPGGKIAQAKDAAQKCYSKCYGDCGVRNQGYRPAGVCVYCSVASRAILPGVSNAPLLFLDDLGTTKPGDWAAEIFYGIMDERVDPVIATSNYTLKELPDRLGHDRIVSRLCGLAHVRELTGEDWRLRK